MKKTLLFSTVLLLCGCSWINPTNPDPNHTHADFAVWFSDQQVNFSRPTFMSNDEQQLHQHMHLHDENGNVMHRHKPGLTLGEFFTSLVFEFTDDCFRLDPDHASCGGKMFVNGVEMATDPNYVFEDTDQILLTYESTAEQIKDQLDQLTKDACLYSQTCPWRGKPPVENCIADPEVPCVAPLE